MLLATHTHTKKKRFKNGCNTPILDSGELLREVTPGPPGLSQMLNLTTSHTHKEPKQKTVKR